MTIHHEHSWSRWMEWTSVVLPVSGTIEVYEVRVCRDSDCEAIEERTDLQVIA